MAAATTQYAYYDFFAGGGMAGFGLGSKWRCLFANDIDDRKAVSYRANHNGGKELLVCDVADLSVECIPCRAHLAWASFPCQDLSLAGKGAGLRGKRSGMFAPFWRLMCQLNDRNRAPKIIALENVYGTITSNGGRDFVTLGEALADLGYRFGAVVIDAVHFVPQSRPRFFLIGVRHDLLLPDVVRRGPSPTWHPSALVEAQTLLSDEAATQWLWWDIPLPPVRTSTLSSLIEDQPSGVDWHSDTETQYLLSLMSDHNRTKVTAAKSAGRKMVGTVYRRTRPDKDGTKQQRAEVRFDEIAGCLRTPAGGSSRQTILVIEGEQVKSRLLSPREAASLMGLPERFLLPGRYNDAYKLAGDGVAVPVVRHLSQHIFEPILEVNRLSLAA